jgi:hypothetical protein
MQLLAAVPANRSALDKLPADSKMLPAWTAGPVVQATPYSVAAPAFTGLLKEHSFDGSVLTPPNYLQGMHVSSQGHYFVCVVSRTSSAPVASGISPWKDETAAPRGAPLLLDGWGNPIIFVPASGLHVKMLHDKPYYDPDPRDPNSTYQTNFDPIQNYIIVSPEGHVTGQGTANPYVDQIGKPFFTSAGADGDFTHGDQVLCSFNN